MWKIMKRLYWKGEEGLRKYCRDKEETIALYKVIGCRNIKIRLD